MNLFRGLSQNLFLKLLSLAFAVLLWFFVVLEDKVEQEVPAEIKVSGVAQDLVLVKKPPTYVTVTVNGPRSILRTLEKNPLVIRLNLKGLGPGKHVIKLKPKYLDLPAGLNVTKINPPQIEIVLERIAKRTVKVEPGIYGSPPPGWKIVRIKVKPERVRVYGPRSVVGKLKVVRTKAVDISGATQDVRKEVPLNLPPLVKAEPETVEIYVKIVEHIVTREIKDLPIHVLGPKEKVKLSNPTVTLLLQGPERLLGAFSDLKIEAYVDARNLKPGKYLLTVKLKLPPGVKLLKMEPRRVRAYVSP